MPELYACKACGLKYKEKKWAVKCEFACSSVKGCDLAITKHAVK